MSHQSPGENQNLPLRDNSVCSQGPLCDELLWSTAEKAARPSENCQYIPLLPEAIGVPSGNFSYHVLACQWELEMYGDFHTWHMSMAEVSFIAFYLYAFL